MHLDAYLQPCPGYGWNGGPQFSTEINEQQSGRERRNGRWSQAKHRFFAPYNNLSREAYSRITSMHMVCRGSLHAFRFRDEIESTAENSLFGIGDGSLTEFQLAKIYIEDNQPYYRYVYAIAGQIQVYVDQVLTTVTVDDRRGKITFASPPANGAVLTWTGTFDVWVRFANDQLLGSIDTYDRINSSVDLLEVAAPEPEED